MIHIYIPEELFFVFFIVKSLLSLLVIDLLDVFLYVLSVFTAQLVPNEFLLSFVSVATKCLLHNVLFVVNLTPYIELNSFALDS